MAEFTVWFLQYRWIMRINFRPILVWLLLACFSLPAFVGQGLHALPGCDHGLTNHELSGHGLSLREQATVDCHGHCHHGHASNAKAKQNDADFLPSEGQWKEAVFAEDHDCSLCAFLAIAKIVRPVSSPLPVISPVLSQTVSSSPGHYSEFCLSTSPRGPPASSCEKCA